MESLIELQNIYYGYKDNTALENVSLTINKGDSTAIIGTNGSGKSTLLKIIAGLYFPDKGRYLYNNDEVTGKKFKDSVFSRSFHKKVGFVFQNSDTQLFCTNVFEEIAFGPNQMGLKDNEVNERVFDCLNLLGIEHLKHREPYHLSEGEKKKVAIASVLSLNPEVIILDEPMNNLDPKTKNYLNVFFQKLNSYGKTIICATHDFEYVKGLFKKAVVLSENHNLLLTDDYDKITGDYDFLRTNNII